MNHFANAVDALDAAVFNGDGLLDVENRSLFKQSMERWQRKLVEWEEIAASLDASADERLVQGARMPLAQRLKAAVWMVGNMDTPDDKAAWWLTFGDLFKEIAADPQAQKYADAMTQDDALKRNPTQTKDNADDDV
jgi:hypothetical protein